MPRAVRSRYLAISTLGESVRKLLLIVALLILVPGCRSARNYLFGASESEPPQNPSCDPYAVGDLVLGWSDSEQEGNARDDFFRRTESPLYNGTGY